MFYSDKKKDSGRRPPLLFLLFHFTHCLLLCGGILSVEMSNHFVSVTNIKSRLETNKSNKTNSHQKILSNYYAVTIICNNHSVVPNLNIHKINQLGYTF